MGNIEKKVIMASAGTGKTYRLSLEFISLLLKYKDYSGEFDFSQIVVMTFTRKATAEIREKILDFLQQLAEGGEESAQIISNLERISNYHWQESDQEYVKTKLLNEILQRKDRLQVSTIDSFTSNIFKSMIAPYLRIKEFNIDNNSNDDIMPKLLEFIFSDQVFFRFESLLKRLNIRTVEEVQGFIKSLLDNRWILDYYQNDTMTGTFTTAMNLDLAKIEEIKENTWKVFKDSYLALVKDYNARVYEPQKKAWHKYLLADYEKLTYLKKEDNLNLIQVIESILADPKRVLRKIDLFFKKPFPFSKTGKKVYKEIAIELEAKFTKTITSLADYYLISELIIQQQEVVRGWKELCKEYDKLKFTLGKFTYNDVTFYTYKYLYEESLSLIDRERGIVTNLFYEQLISRFRFLLIDEFQDTSFNQFSILMPIITELISGHSVKDYSGVIIVGDPKQSIYGWRGGERGIMEIMPKKLGVESEELSQCYRSTRPVIDIVNSIFTDSDFQESSLKAKRVWSYSPVTAKNWDAIRNCYNETKEEGGELFYWEHNEKSDSKANSDEDDVPSDNTNKEETLTSYEMFAQQIRLLHQAGKIEWGQTAILVRKQKHAKNIANELNKLNIPNNIESSGKLLEHKGVEILLTILKFKLFQDSFSLLQILRSDLVLLEAKTLTEILKILHNSNSNDDKKTYMTEISKFPECQKLLTLVNKSYTSQAHFIREVIANYDFNRVCQNEIDWKNIYTFLELVISFELAKINTTTFDLFGFMEYCQKQLETDSEILQEGLQLENSISILTVHKSKGLGFKNVFLYWQLSNRKPRNQGNKFKLAYTFDRKTYLGLNDFVIYSSSKDEKVLKLAGENELMQDYEEREIIEAIDVFYVALTRAEHSLGLFFSYKSSLDFESFMDSLKDEAGVIGQLVTAYKKFFRERNGENLSRANLGYFHYFQPRQKQRKEKPIPANESIPKQINFLQKYLTDYSLPNFEENKPRENMKKVYLEDRHQLLGNVAHEYLNYIKYGEEKEFLIAKSMVFKKFGSLLNREELRQAINICHKFIRENQEIFDRKWDKVFNEKTVFQKGKEYRIDRMMVNSKTKEVMIIDYKTGGIYDENQVNNYVDIIKEIPFVKENGFRVEGKFMEVS